MAKDVTKEALFTALMLLMEQKDYEKITITDITKKAGVSRMSFYRVYNAKEDILLDAVDRFFSEFQEGFINYMSESFINKYSGKLKENKNLIIGLDRAGCDEKLFDIVLRYHMELYKKYLNKNSLSDKDMLFLHYHTGGIHRMMKYWASLDFDISSEEISAACKELLPDILK